MNIDHGKRTWTAAELDELRGIIRGLAQQSGLTQAQICRESSVAGATLSQFLSGTYAGDNQKIATQLARWLDARNREAEVLQSAPPAPTFVMTPTAEKVMMALQHAQVLSDMAIVVGSPGVGKSAAAHQYAASTPRVLIVTASPANNSVNAMLASVITAHSGRVPPHRSRLERSALVRQIVDQGHLLVIDEAQHCTMDALEEMRAIHDDRACGLVFMGNATVLSRIEGAQRDPAYAQLFSRAGWRVKIDRSSEADVHPVLETMGVSNPDVTAYCVQIAKRDSLRVVVKTVRSALMFSRAAREDLSTTHLAAAYRQLGGAVRS